MPSRANTKLFSCRKITSVSLQPTLRKICALHCKKYSFRWVFTSRKKYLESGRCFDQEIYYPKNYFLSNKTENKKLHLVREHSPCHPPPPEHIWTATVLESVAKKAKLALLFTTPPLYQLFFCWTCDVVLVMKRSVGYFSIMVHLISYPPIFCRKSDFAFVSHEGKKTNTIFLKF